MSPAEVASIVTAPASCPVIVFVATPAEAVALPVPLTVPAPLCCAKATTVVLSEVTVLPAASSIVAVRTRVAPEVRLAVEPLSAIWVGGTVDDVEGAERAGGEPGGGRLHRDGAGEDAGDRLGRDAARCGGVAGAADGACAGRLRERDDGRVVGGDGVAGGVLDRGGQHPRRAGGEVGGGAAQRDLGRRAVDDRERAERPRRQPGGSRFHRHRAGEHAGDRLGRDAARCSRVAGRR